MKKTGKILYIVFYAIIAILAICAILSIFRNTGNRYLKFLDFPRIQFFIISLTSLLLLITTTKKRYWYTYAAVAALCVGLLINGTFLIHYTSLVPVVVPATQEQNASDSPFSLLLANVQMSNKKAQPLINLIATKKPDLILAMEVDEWWNKQLKILEKEYPYSQHTINELAYGMVLYSKFPLKRVEVDYLNNKKVPSFESTIALNKSKNISFHSIHPVPPTHFENLPDNAGQKETALKELGQEIKGRKFPTLVAGDLNDVIWSYVDEITNTENILFDVRVGRGFYNSFNAENIFIRWPLDHVFVTKEFRLKKLERLPKIGSDHFPLYVELVL